MSVNSSQRTHVIGASTVVVGLSAIVEVKAGANINGCVLSLASGGPAFFSNGASATIGSGVSVGSSAYNITGPYNFYLSATGATATINLVNSLSDGGSL